MRLVLRALAATSLCVLVLACSSTSDNVGVGDDAGSGDDGGPTPNPPPPNPPPPPVDAGQDAGPACGRLTTPCPSGGHCDGAPDCQSKVCRMNVCQDASMADGVKNGDETDVDCGGMHAPACADGKMCLVADDCVSAVCTGGVCQVPNDHDGVKNGDETGVDCGGSASNKCAPGQGCNTTADCAQVKCDTVAHVCLTASHSDGIENDGETGIDCGGATGAARCDVGGGCLADGDCNNVKCDVGATNQCLPPSHTDGFKNGDETGVDCGGPTAPNRCPTGQGCVTTADCDDVKCDAGATNLCLPPSHTDNIKNDGETGVDCGGAALPTKCATGQGCGSDADCNNVRCNMISLVCDPATSTDGLKNGTETDIDCGGAAAPKCISGKMCSVAGDCATAACSAGTGTCALPSCSTTETAGIVTCGAGETGAPGATHESCCKSLTLPTRTTKRLDKYEITAGRFRTFLASVGPDVRTWVANYVAGHPTSQLATIPNQATVSTIYPNADRFVAHSLTAHMELDIDNYGGIRGCYNGYTACTKDADCGGAAGSCATVNGVKACTGSGDYSANTYWMDATHESDFGIPPRATLRSVSDEKSLNCVMPLMLAAFCAWDDDGELATLADYHDAWTATYPWGASDLLRPKYNWCNGTYDNGGFTCQCDGSHNAIPSAACPAPASQFQVDGENGVFYEYPLATDRSLDNEPLIAAPGRFPFDATSAVGDGETWMDLFANMAEYTGDFVASSSDWCDFSVDGGAGGCTRGNHAGTGVHYTNIPNIGIIGRTWEGHNYGRGSSNAFAATFQYGKFGGRCVRPVAKY